MKLAFKISLWCLGIFVFGQIVIGALCGIIFFLWAMLEQFAQSVGWIPAVISLMIVGPLAVTFIVRGRIFPATQKR